MAMEVAVWVEFLERLAKWLMEGDLVRRADGVRQRVEVTVGERGGEVARTVRLVEMERVAVGLTLRLLEEVVKGDLVDVRHTVKVRVRGTNVGVGVERGGLPLGVLLSIGAEEKVDKEGEGAEDGEQESEATLVPPPEALREIRVEEDGEGGRVGEIRVEAEGEREGKAEGEAATPSKCTQP